MSGGKEKNSVNYGASLEELLAETSKDDQRDEPELYVAKLHIRKKQKGDNLRALGSRVPLYMIEELKMLADYHDVHAEDLVAGILEQVLNDNMEEVYKKIESDMRRRRRGHKA